MANRKARHRTTWAGVPFHPRDLVGRLWDGGPAAVGRRGAEALASVEEQSSRLARSLRALIPLASRQELLALRRRVASLERRLTQQARTGAGTGTGGEPTVGS